MIPRLVFALLASAAVAGCQPLSLRDQQASSGGLRSAGSTRAKSAAQKKQLAARRKKQAEPSLLSSIFYPEPKQPQTLGEWMSQERLDP